MGNGRDLGAAPAPRELTGVTGGPDPADLAGAAASQAAGGVAFIATLRGVPGRDIIDHGLTALRKLDHRRGGPGGGAGLLTQIPDALIRDVTGADLPRAGRYCVGMAFLPAGEAGERIREAIGLLAAEEGLNILSWRRVPTDPDVVAGAARESMPDIWQVVVESGAGPAPGAGLAERAYRLRKRAEHATGVYFASFSHTTLVYKALVGAEDLDRFYPDLADPRFASQIAVVHSRAVPPRGLDWAHAHPFRLAAHDGTITSIHANRTWLGARQHTLASEALGDLEPVLPVCTSAESPAASFDEMLDLLHTSGRSLPHAVLMMMPEAWEQHTGMDPHHRAFYQYYATMTEPWDGPAAVCFTDGRYVGAVLDRHGLRSGRYVLTEDGLVVLSSEAGVVDIDPGRITRKGRLAPGRMFLVDTRVGQVLEDPAVKTPLAEGLPYSAWLEGQLRPLVPDPRQEPRPADPDAATVARWHRDFGYRDEEVAALLLPAAMTGIPPTTSAAILVAEARGRLLFDFFRDPLPQVTQAPVDALREEVVSSLAAAIGPEANLLLDGPEHARKLVVRGPAIGSDELAALAAFDGRDGGFTSRRIPATFDPDDPDDPFDPGEQGEPDTSPAGALRRGLQRLRHDLDDAVADGVDFLILSDRTNGRRVPIPSLLATAAANAHLLRSGHRTRVGLVVEAGDVRDVHQLARLIDYGAACVNPYVALATVVHLVRSGRLSGLSPQVAQENLLTSLGRGFLRVMGDTGISALGAYRGSRPGHILGLDEALIQEFFPGTSHAIGGIALEELAEDVLRRRGARAGEGPPQPLPAPIDLLDLGTGEEVPISGVEPASLVRQRIHTPSDTREHSRLDVTASRYGLTATALKAAHVLHLAPPPHHDVTGCDDLAQLVRDLSHANPTAKVWIELLVEPDMAGYVAAITGAYADAVVIRSPHREPGRCDEALADLHRSGLPWEFGLMTTRRELDRVRARDVGLVADTALRDGREVVLAALLGADEYVLAHGTDVEAVVEEVRALLGALGARGLGDLVGRSELLDCERALTRWRAAGLDLGGLLRPEAGRFEPVTEGGVPGPSQVADARARGRRRRHRSSLDEWMADRARDALDGAVPVELEAGVTSADGSVGTALGALVTDRYGAMGLPSGTITITLRGTAGQSLGAFLPAGLTLTVIGEANDSVAKGLSGGRVIVRPDRASIFAPSNNVIAGNVVGYGATSGSVFLAGTVGERFALRNDGATLICEGAGDHAGEFMSGGTVLVLGATGRNLCAAMSGGVAYVLDLDETMLHGEGMRVGELRADPVDEFDLRALTVLLAEHAEVTRSRIATELLLNPDDIAARVTRIQPRTTPAEAAGHHPMRVNHVTNAWERIIARRWH